MGATQAKPQKWKRIDILYLGIEVKTEVKVPTSDPLLFDYTQRRKYGCKHIISVKPAGTFSVYIHAVDCTPYEAAEEYREIVNKQLGYNDDDDTDEAV